MSTSSEFRDAIERMAQAELDEWVCSVRRGVEWPGTWSPLWGPRPDDWVKATCGRDGCKHCGGAA